MLQNDQRALLRPRVLAAFLVGASLSLPVSASEFLPERILLAHASPHVHTHVSTQQTSSTKQKNLNKSKTSKNKKSTSYKHKASTKKRNTTSRQQQASTRKKAVTPPAQMVQSNSANDPSTNKLNLLSSSVVIYDTKNGEVLFEKQANEVRPIASLTKLMTAMVVLDAKLSMSEVLTVTDKDVDRLRHSRSKLPVGSALTRKDMLLLSLAASENRAASSLAHNYPGGFTAFVAAMNAKSRALNLNNTRFVESTGLDDRNVSTASDLVKLIVAANKYPVIREMSTTGTDYVMEQRRHHKIGFMNTNALVRNKGWDVNVSKTGYIIPAGYCLVMHTVINNRSLAVILLNSQGKHSKFGDANRIKKWLQQADSPKRASAKVAAS